ncbi:zinc-finger of the MIZ type in Nse subunit-domain-containing protein [Thamnidium elegans]|nr:zinc-finger of the MIZ type in Nse subunit-domain-containing protein [Thamnidium elegans]
MDVNFKELMDLDNRVRNQTLTMRALADRIMSGEKIKDIMVPYEQVQKSFEDEWNNNEKRYNASEKYSAFRQNIWNIHHPDEIMPSLDENEDDDIVMGSTKISLRCPLTTAWLQDPVTSNLCKHTFSRAAITDLLRQSGGSVPCPIPGCNKRIIPLCLIADDIMAERVRRARARDEQNASTSQYFDVE